MLAFIFALIGFLTAIDQPLGASLINAFEWMSAWFYFLIALTTFVYTILYIYTLRIGISFGQALDNSKIGILFGAMLGITASSLIAVIIFIRLFILLLLSNYLCNTIDPSIDSISLLNIKEIGAIVLLFTILFLPDKKLK